MSLSDAAVVMAMLAGAVALVAANVVLQRLARPDRGSERIAGCCGMVLSSAITDPHEDDR